MKCKLDDHVKFIGKNQIMVGTIMDIEEQDGTISYLIISHVGLELQWRKEEEILLDFNLPIIPQAVADNLEEDKEEEVTLYDSLHYIVEYFNGNSEIYKWLVDDVNYSVYAKAWLDGYDVEEGK